VHTALETLAPLIAEKQTDLIIALPDDILAVRGDRDRLQQVFVNLVSNAIRYSSNGKPVWVAAMHDGDQVVLKVRDEGRGIPRTMLSEIFELFVQNEQGLERSSGGLGLGLTVVRKIIELHGGQVEAFSDGPGAGSEFMVRLPRQRNAVIRNGSRKPETSAAQRILVVEDQDDSREMMHVLLQSKGHVVIEAADGQAAIEAIEREHPDIALVDIGLPVVSGYDVARQIRENPLFDDVLLVALTGYGRDSDVQNAKSAGFDEHLTKPANADHLDEILRRRGRRLRAS
jgi:CheY-like chemotaxis protein